MKLILKNLIRAYFPAMFALLRQFKFEFFSVPTEFKSHVNKLSKSDIVIDLGANVGLVSNFLARTGAQVISFEPNSQAFLELKSVASKYSNIELRNEAAGIKNQKIKLFLHKNINITDEDLTQSSSLIADKPNVSQHYFELVNEIDFAQFLKSQSRPIELIKMDIEGYEVQLLNYLLDEKVIKNVNHFYVETHERQFPELASQTQTLKERIRMEGFEDKFFSTGHNSKFLNEGLL